MTTDIRARDELEVIVAEYRHVRSGQQRADRKGSVRRHLLARLGRLEGHFERLREIADQVLWLEDGRLRAAERSTVAA